MKMIGGFDFRQRYKINQSIIEDGKKEHSMGLEYFARVHIVYTKVGIVTIYETNWQTNFGQQIFSYFKTIIDGYCYGAFLDKANLSDAQIKWMSSHFVERIKYMLKKKIIK